MSLSSVLKERIGATSYNKCVAIVQRLSYHYRNILSKDEVIVILWSHLVKMGNEWIKKNNKVFIFRNCQGIMRKELRNYNGTYDYNKVPMASLDNKINEEENITFLDNFNDYQWTSCSCSLNKTPEDYYKETETFNRLKKQLGNLFNLFYGHYICGFTWKELGYRSDHKVIRMLRNKLKQFAI